MDDVGVKKMDKACMEAAVGWRWKLPTACSRAKETR